VKTIKVIIVLKGGLVSEIRASGSISAVIVDKDTLDTGTHAANEKVLARAKNYRRIKGFFPA
jgi:hypothetical protein